MDTAERLVWDYRTADKLDAGDRMLCNYAVSLTLAPGRVGQSEIKELKQAGFSDEQITIAVQVIGYFNYINRVADGLGVDLDPGMDELFDGVEKDDWLQRKATFE